MQEFTINLREDGSAVIARDKWNKDRSIKAMNEKPFLFEVGQKVVDIFSNVVTIKEIIKHQPLKQGCCPEWNLLVEENNNCYRYTEIAGVYVRTVDSTELKALIEENPTKLPLISTNNQNLSNTENIGKDLNKAEKPCDTCHRKYGGTCEVFNCERFKEWSATAEPDL